MITFVVPGEAQAQGRPRAFIRKGPKPRIGVIDPKKSREYKAYFKWCAAQAAPPSLLEGPIEVEVIEYRKIPKSMPKYKKRMAEEGKLFPTKRPDVDNIIKILMDACNKLIWKDDSQVYKLTVTKLYGDPPRVEIKIKEVGA